VKSVKLKGQNASEQQSPELAEDSLTILLTILNVFSVLNVRIVLQILLILHALLYYQSAWKCR
jgi:hypothetical protein